MYTLTVRHECDTAHRLYRYDGPCGHIHGHRYVIAVSVEAQELDDRGISIDFGVLKGMVRDWVDTNWDHRLLLNCEDVLFQEDRLADEWHAITEMGGNPTAENMAKVLFRALRDFCPPHIFVKSVKIWETPDCSVEYKES